MITVLLIDDHSMLRRGFRLILEAEPDIVVVGEASDGVVGVKTAIELQPAVVIMDIRMPRMNGIAATAAITAASASKVLIVTTFDLDEYVYEGLRAGASGFLLKDASPEDLVAAVRNIAAGNAVIAPAATRRMLDNVIRFLPSDEQESRRATILDSLTDREYAVFCRMAEGKSNREIAADLNLAHGTVKLYVGKILSKLELRDRVQAVVLAYENGFVIPRQTGNAAKTEI